MFKNRSESKAKMNCFLRAATACGLFSRLQQFLVVAFLPLADRTLKSSLGHFGGVGLLAFAEIDSIVRTVMVSVFGSRIPITFTFRPAHCSAIT